MTMTDLYVRYAPFKHLYPVPVIRTITHLTVENLYLMFGKPDIFTPCRLLISPSQQPFPRPSFTTTRFHHQPRFTPTTIRFHHPRNHHPLSPFRLLSAFRPGPVSRQLPALRGKQYLALRTALF